LAAIRLGADFFADFLADFFTDFFAAMSHSTMLTGTFPPLNAM
jgi:hypothetical protein